MKRMLSIAQADDGYYTVFTGSHVADKLQFDEMLGLIATWAIKPDGRTPYSTPVENYWEVERRLRAEIEASLRPVDRLLREKAAP